MMWLLPVLQICCCHQGLLDLALLIWPGKTRHCKFAEVQITVPFVLGYRLHVLEYSFDDTWSYYNTPFVVE